MTKTNLGRFFEDYSMGMVLEHAVPRTVGEGERALYHALYPVRHALYSSDEFARACGFKKSPLDDLIAFHIIFGKTVPDVSLNAIANLGYAMGRWHRPVYAGDTLSSTSKVIGLKQNSNDKSGVVYVHTEGKNQNDEAVMDYVRWVMVRKRDLDAAAPETVIPPLPKVIDPSDLVLPQHLCFASYDFKRTGEPHRWGDYNVGEIIDHVDGVTVDDSEHILATRLWQNTSKVHFDVSQRPDARRLVYGGHVISMARALSFNGLANAQMIVGLNAGTHANPCFAGTTIRAYSEVLDMSETKNPSVGALRLRLVAHSGLDGHDVRDENGKYKPEVLLDMDYWALMPR